METFIPIQILQEENAFESKLRSRKFGDVYWSVIEICAPTPFFLFKLKKSVGWNA